MGTASRLHRQPSLLWFIYHLPRKGRFAHREVLAALNLHYYKRTRAA
jgi:hypothetical protein